MKDFRERELRERGYGETSEGLSESEEENLGIIYIA